MTRTAPRLFRIGLAMALFLALVAGGCEKEEPPPLVVKKAVPKEAAKGPGPPQPAAAAEAKPSPAAVYDPAGKRDPFTTFLRVEKKEDRSDRASLPPLQRVELGELRFVGVIWDSDRTRALVEDSEGKGYTVMIGTKIGREGGVVTKITNEEIFVREQFRDYTGAKVERENSLKLQTGGGK
ncbi:MAG TPA: pilus assembly protein PilP [Candidatus Deferrimicrobiaceae bacterium]|nr:pilus assembly protein PilP [Candidatus Deferrimicrobiaceae bacterium]